MSKVMIVTGAGKGIGAPTVPLGREGYPSKIAETAVWLCSDAASGVHGAILDVSGGR